MLNIRLSIYNWLEIKVLFQSDMKRPWPSVPKNKFKIGVICATLPTIILIITNLRPPSRK